MPAVRRGLSGLLVGVALALLWAQPVWVNGDDVAAPVAGAGAAALWVLVAVVSALGIDVAVLVLYGRLRGVEPGPLAALLRSDYMTRVRNFSPNAKLLLARSLITGINFGMWHVLFNLYLLGRRKVFLVAYSFAVVLRAVRIFTLDPTSLLAFSALGGMAEGFHAITEPPFMMEQSRPEERVHLFSLSAVFVAVSLTVGSLLAGWLPLGLAGLLGVEARRRLAEASGGDLAS